MPLYPGIEATSTPVIEPEPIPKNEHDGEHKHPSRGRNGAPLHQFAAALPGRHGLCRADHGIGQRRLQSNPGRLSFSRGDRPNFIQDALHGYVDLSRNCLVQVAIPAEHDHQSPYGIGRLDAEVVRVMPDAVTFFLRQVRKKNAVQIVTC